MRLEHAVSIHERHDPEVAAVERSIHEEAQAIRDYTDRAAAATDPEIIALYRHLIEEETRHHAELTAWWAKRSPG